MRNDRRIYARAIALTFPLLLSACQADTASTDNPKSMNNPNSDKREYIVLNVVSYNYTKQSIFDVFLSRMNAGGAGPLRGGGNIMAGVRLPLGEQTLTWRDAATGETTTAKNRLAIDKATLPAGTRYLGVHVYPDETAELTFAPGLPGATERGKQIYAEAKKNGE